MTSFALTTTEPGPVTDALTELEVYAEMLTYMRPAGSKAEKRFIKKFIRPLGAEPDGFGNYWFVLGKDTKVLWSSHTDTVHRQGGYQEITAKDGLISAVGSNCLGADCTTGVWLMRQMILAKVPGVYVFHRQEECGGVGSNFIAKTRPEILDTIDYAIAFDRKGNKSVITHQMGQRCASEAFVRSIAPMLPNGDYESDDGGTFTDTANYMDFIPECTNISVGYLAQHTPKETQDVRHLIDLAKCMIAFDETKLVAARDPKVIDLASWSKPGLGKHPANSNYMTDAEWSAAIREYDDDPAFATINKGLKAARAGVGSWEPERKYALNVYDVVKDYAAEVADFLEQLGYDAEGLMEEMGYVDWKSRQ